MLRAISTLNCADFSHNFHKRESLVKECLHFRIQKKSDKSNCRQSLNLYIMKLTLRQHIQQAINLHEILLFQRKTYRKVHVVFTKLVIGDFDLSNRPYVTLYIEFLNIWIVNSIKTNRKIHRRRKLNSSSGTRLKYILMTLQIMHCISYLMLKGYSSTLHTFIK